MKTPTTKHTARVCHVGPSSRHDPHDHGCGGDAIGRALVPGASEYDDATWQDVCDEHQDSGSDFEAFEAADEPTFSVTVDGVTTFASDDEEATIAAYSSANRALPPGGEIKMFAFGALHLASVNRREVA